MASPYTKEAAFPQLKIAVNRLIGTLPLWPADLIIFNCQPTFYQPSLSDIDLLLHLHYHLSNSCLFQIIKMKLSIVFPVALMYSGFCAASKEWVQTIWTPKVAFADVNTGEMLKASRPEPAPLHAVSESDARFQVSIVGMLLYTTYLNRNGKIRTSSRGSRMHLWTREIR